MGQKPQNPLAVWWIIWGAIISGLVMIRTLNNIPPSSPAADPVLRFLPAVPLIISTFIRWNLLPAATDKTKALRLFIIGIALAEGCGILGIFVVPQFREVYFALALVGLIQYAPVFAKRFES